MEIRVLGPIEVRHDGSPALLRGAKPRQLLSLLAIRPNRPVTAEQLVHELWEDNPPPSAATALRVHVARLRGVLELDRNPNAPSGRLPAGPHGYLLRVEPDELDAQRFERLILIAREAIASGDPTAAVPQLTQALDLWRGPALSDAHDLSAAAPEIARLEDLRAIAIEELADARLALGEHSLVVDLVTAGRDDDQLRGSGVRRRARPGRPRADVALDDYPLRERLTASLIRALYATGRQAKALHAYADLAHRLDEELGVPPSPELRKLEEDVLLQRPSLDVAARRAPAVVTRPSRVRFIGRRSELKQLLNAYDRAACDCSQLVLVAGSAGLGKTTLVRELLTRVQRPGESMLIGHCDPEPTATYQPIVEILRTLVGAVDESRRATLPDELRLVLPELGDVPAPAASERAPATATDADKAQFRLFEAIAATLSALAARPVVLVVEDVHWADRPTLELIRHLVRHPDLDHTLTVATLREDETDTQRSELIRRLAPSAQRTRVELDAFDEHEVRALIRATAPPETMQSLVDLTIALQDATGGNPFFLREILRELDEQCIKSESPTEIERALANLAPAGVRALIHRRLERLTADARRVVSAAAVVGRELMVDVLADVCDLSRDATFEALEEALATRLLTEDVEHVDRCEFPHVLVRNAVYAAIPAAERRQFHLRVARVLETRPEFVRSERSAELARHYTEAAPPGLERQTAAYAQLAGDDAAYRFAFAEAARWYEQAIVAYESARAPRDDLGRLYLALGRAHSHDRQPEQARDALLVAAECARRSGDPTLLADVAVSADLPWSGDFEPSALALLEEALSGIDPDDVPRRVQLLTRLASKLYHVDADREGRVAREALAVAQHTNRPAIVASALGALHLWITHRPAARGERLALGRRADELAWLDRTSSDVHLLTRRSLLIDLLENAALPEFEVRLNEYEDAARSAGSPSDIYSAMALRATLVAWYGDLDAAEQLARGAALRGRALGQFTEGALLLHRFVIRYQQGRLAEEVSNVRPVEGQTSVYRAGASLGALALAETGRAERGADIAWRILGPDGSELPRDGFWLAALSLFASVANAAHDTELAALIHELIAPCTDHLVLFGGGGAVLGSVHHWLGLVAMARGATDAALEHLTEAAAVSERLGAPYWIAQAKVDAARALHDRGRPRVDAVVALLDEASEIARHRGYGRVLAAVEDLR